METAPKEGSAGGRTAADSRFGEERRQERRVTPRDIAGEIGEDGPPPVGSAETLPDIAGSDEQHQETFVELVKGSKEQTPKDAEKERHNEKN